MRRRQSVYTVVLITLLLVIACLAPGTVSAGESSVKLYHQDGDDKYEYKDCTWSPWETFYVYEDLFIDEEKPDAQTETYKVKVDSVTAKDDNVLKIRDISESTSKELIDKGLCPFCGAEAKIRPVESNGTMWYYIVCSVKNCRSNVKSDWSETQLNKENDITVNGRWRLTVGDSGSSEIVINYTKENGDKGVHKYTITVPVYHEVTFRGDEENGEVIYNTQYVADGKAAIPPEYLPTREGYVFGGWDTDFDNVTSDLTVSAIWKSTGVVASGTEGNITWSLDGSGLLTIDGSGIIQNYSSSSLPPWNKYRKSITSVEIKEGVTCIGDYSFYNCYNLTTITVPDSITSIGAYAFYNCSKLASADIPKGVTNIGKVAFGYCIKLSEVNLPAEIECIETRVFENCVSLKNIAIPDNVANIGIEAFKGCSNLIGIKIPDSLTVIEDGAFEECKSLVDIKISNNLMSIGSFAFKECSSLKHIDIPDRVTSIGVTTFEGCTSLTKVDIPDSVTSIRYSAFERCTNLVEIKIPDSVTSIGPSAFEGCTSLKEVVLPDSVISVERYTFKGCTSLTEIEIPGNVTSIGDSAFYECSSLIDIKIPDSVISIGNDAFMFCNPSKVIRCNPQSYAWKYAVNKGWETKCINHEWDTELTVDKEASCTEEGSRSIHCKNCKETKDVKVIKATGHKWDDGKEIKAATCIEKGEKLFRCTVCNTTKTENIEALGHIYSDEYIVDKVPTCMEKGSKSRHCTREGCSAIDPDSEEEIEKSEHSYSDEYTVEKEATFFHNGTAVIKCKNCNKIIKEKLLYYDENTIRIYGSNRYATSTAAADALKKSLGVDKFENIIVASGADYPDALAGSYLAKVKNAPVMLVGKDVNTEADVKQYINKNLKKGGTVYLLGGTGVVTSRFEKSLGDLKVERLGGQTRYETNIAILKAAGVDKEDLLVCTGEGFADSLSASAVGKPILLVAGSGVNDTQKKYLGSLKINDIYLIGGTGVVSDKIGTQLKKYDQDDKCERVAGQNRYLTSVAVAKEFFPKGSDSTVLAYAMNFPDGLAGGPLALSIKAPLILTDNSGYSDAVAYAKNAGIKKVVVLGGPTLISDGVVKKVIK